jgi:hypothetical protein
MTSSEAPTVEVIAKCRHCGRPIGRPFLRWLHAETGKIHCMRQQPGHPPKDGSPRRWVESNNEADPWLAAQETAVFETLLPWEWRFLEDISLRSRVPMGHGLVATLRSLRRKTLVEVKLDRRSGKPLFRTWSPS